MSNPFEDPDVKAAQKSFANSAYEEDNGMDNTSQQQPLAPTSTTKASIISSGYNDSNTATIAAKVGGSIAINAAQNVSDNYKKQTASQSDHNSMPAPPNWCVRVFNWIPIRWFAFIGGCALIALPIVEIVFKTSIIYSLIYIYLIFFGILTIIIESPVFLLTRRIQLGIYYWFRLLSRTWGRAWFYVFITVLCFRLGTAVPICVGIYMLIIAIAMFFYSKLAAEKYVRIYVFVSAGGENDELKRKFDTKFDELDINRDQFIGSQEIVKLAEQAGRTLSNAERHAIQTFLDVSCNGRISKTDFWKQFSTYNMKQKFL